jgi:hypothetical protein
MSTPINPAGASQDPLLGTDKTSSRGARRRHDAGPGDQNTDAAEVTISRQAATASEPPRVGETETVGEIENADQASQLVKALAQQITEQPAAARDAQAHGDAKAALNLLI